MAENKPEWEPSSEPETEPEGEGEPEGGLSPEAEFALDVSFSVIGAVAAVVIIIVVVVRIYVCYVAVTELPLQHFNPCELKNFNFEIFWIDFTSMSA